MRRRAPLRGRRHGPSAALLVVIAALCATGCGLPGKDGAAPDTRGGIAGRLGTGCRHELARIDAAAARRIGSLARLDAARARSKARGLRLRRTLARQRARVGVARRALARARPALRRFLAAHPEQALAPADYAAYRRIRRPYDASFARVNATIDVVNATVATLNRVVAAVNANGRAANRLYAAEASAARRSEAAEQQCLATIGDWERAVARIERRLAPAAGRAGRRAPAVSCDSPQAWRRVRASEPGYERTGFVRGGEDVIHLAPRTCAALARLVSHPTRLGCAAVPGALALCPPRLEAEAVAVVTLAHEQQHVDGVFDEAEAQCYAFQRAQLTARQLGLPGRVAARIAGFTRHSISQPPAYRSRECRAGGALDLRLAGGWPAGL